ncbi:sigma-70 family RNA polymerase sigma factor [Catenuloplanes nepalensis]|uniref:sigma-70 family RNA polymerase sigma factor n=1 Tax=Catenuloplanes nepalensis TaxID=587533 RepID=UPI0027D8E463|nr:sigma-70 family RNA polymerase sigma factor [Catenuloplanes nepalensis]
MVRHLYDEYGDPLMKFLTRLTSERQHAEDLLQETMLRAWRHSDSLPEGWESRRRWLFTVARRLAIDAARFRRKRPSEVGALDLTRMPADRDEAEAVVAKHTVRGALPRLSEAHRTVLVALFHQGLSRAELAAALDVPEGTIKSRTHYALRALRDLVESQ